LYYWRQNKPQNESNEQIEDHAAFISDRTFSIPLSPKLTDKDVDDVIKAIKKISNYYQR